MHGAEWEQEKKKNKCSVKSALVISHSVPTSGSVLRPVGAQLVTGVSDLSFVCASVLCVCVCPCMHVIGHVCSVRPLTASTARAFGIEEVI